MLPVNSCWWENTTPDLNVKLVIHKEITFFINNTKITHIHPSKFEQILA